MRLILYRSRFILPVAILALPWQTRWFLDAALAGWPWEQGRIAIYGSWLLMIAVVIYALRPAQIVSPSREGSTPVGDVLPLLALIIISFVASRFDTLSLRAVAQWWIQVLLIVAFCWAIWRARLPAREVTRWFALSLIPELGLAAWQQLSQQVVGSKWLGIAAQLPATKGVSVIEAHGDRVLRLYGGFPHPNIFGGWLAMGFVASLWLAMTASSLKRTLAWSGLSAATLAALVLTFSRSAWIAAAGGAALVAMTLCRNIKASELDHVAAIRRCLAVCFLPLLTTAAVVISQRQLIFTRLDPSARLEVKSVDERAQSLRDGLALVRVHPFIGTGPNAELPTLARLRGQGSPTIAPAPLESPHNVFLLVLVNFGALGLGLALVVSLRLIAFRFQVAGFRLQVSGCRFQVSSASRLASSVFLLLPLFVLALLDHYLWSYWSGQVLAALTLTIVFLPGDFLYQKTDDRPS